MIGSISLMNFNIKLFLNTFLLLLQVTFFCRDAFAYKLNISDDLSKVDFYLHTVDVGNRVFDNFGHTAIRIHDREKGINVLLNWGLFDFSDPLSFSIRFYKGILRYKLGVFPYRLEMRRYSYEKRRVWEDKLNITESQKKTLLNRFRWNMKAENVAYDYQYFFDNCSTRPRDYIDEAVSGKVFQTYSKLFSKETFRDMVRSHYATNPEVGMSLDILMNSRLDRKMTYWEKAFLPLTLRQILLKTPSDIEGENGVLPLLGETKILVDHDPPKPFSFSLQRLIFLSSALVVVLVLLSKRSSNPMGIFFSKVSYRLLGFLAIVLGLYMGLLGVVMPASWILSSHLDLHHNANILVFWVFDLVLLFWGIGWFIRGRELICSF